MQWTYTIIVAVAATLGCIGLDYFVFNRMVKGPAEPTASARNQSPPADGVSESEKSRRRT